MNDFFSYNELNTIMTVDEQVEFFELLEEAVVSKINKNNKKKEDKVWKKN